VVEDDVLVRAAAGHYLRSRGFTVVEAVDVAEALHILAADRFGLPVSTTHVLTSGVAGTMAANHSGLQWGTLRALGAAWLMTLPASIALSGGLFWIFRHLL